MELKRSNGNNNSVSVQVQQLVGVVAWLISVVLFLWFFDAVKVLLLGFLAAAALAATLRPFVQRIPGPHGLVALLIGIAPPIVLLGLLALIVWFAAEPIQRQLNFLPEMEQQLNDTLTTFSLRLGLAEPLSVKGIAMQLLDMVTGESGAQFFSTTAGVASDILVSLAFVFIGSIYMLLSPPDHLLMPALRLLPMKWRGEVKDAIEELGPRLRWWAVGTAISALTIGVASWIGYVLVGNAKRFAHARDTRPRKLHKRRLPKQWKEKYYSAFPTLGHIGAISRTTA